METIRLKKILFDAATRLGWKPVADLSNLEQWQRDQLAGAMNERLEEAVGYDWWPDFMRVEERWYRPFWTVTDTYADGDEVWDETEEKYYLSLQDGNTGHLVTDVLFWEEATDLDRYVLQAQVGETVLGSVRGVYSKNPRKNKYAGELAKMISEHGVQVDSLAGNSVWIEFRVKAPEITCVPWDETVVYDVGDVCWVDEPGEAYRSLTDANVGNDPVQTATEWQKVEIPSYFRFFLVEGVFASLLQETEDARKEKAEGRAYDMLARARDMVISQQGENGRADVIQGY